MGVLDRSVSQAVFDTYAQGRAFSGAEMQGLSPWAQWSAALDERTCDWCAWADLRIFDTRIEPWDPPVHFGCRCIVAYIKEDEYRPVQNWGTGPPNNAFPPGRKKGEVSGRTITANKVRITEVRVTAASREAAHAAAVSGQDGVVAQVRQVGDDEWLVTIENPVSE